MTLPQVKLKLDGSARTYCPGELLSGSYHLEGVPSQEVRAVELSVLWYTEGKGDEDMSIHFFERTEPQNGEAFDVREPRQFSTTLPNSPLSYRGLIVKICWRVRARVFLARSKELSSDVPFRLGHVPDAEDAIP